MAKGIDIYGRYQTVTDWPAVARSAAFVWVKVSDGGGPSSVRGDKQVSGAKSVSIPVGGYHYAQLSPSPEAQADVLLAEVDRLGAHGLVPMLDIEAPFIANLAARQFAERFCSRVAARTGRRPGVYTSDSFARVLRPDTWPCNPVIWIARYGAKPAYGGRYDIHQYSSAGSVPGISGAVDLNESYTNAHLTGGSEMELTDTYTDWAGNVQTVKGTLDHLDQRLAELHEHVMTPRQSEVDPAASLRPLDYLPYIDGYTHTAAQQAGGVDVEALAKRIADLIGPGFVQAVADELHRRLQS